ncbi:Outer envelope protein 80 [Citrus sinensis]|uniref:Outer envelope protein 80 n=1 Tax=Citrus sinensis TaxID=2711 RepID=A0ACB8MVK3_CITSI|nr:Outer envelope protein 80 [Citrus sinensis]
MAQKNDDARFTSSPLKIPRFQPQPPLPFFAETLTESKNSLSHQIHSLRTRSDESTQSTELTQPESLTRKLQLFAERAYGNSARVCSMYPSTTGAGETLVNLPLLCSAWMSLSQSTTSESAALPEVSSTQLQQKAQQQPHSVSRSDEERVLISEVLVRNKDGEELERKYLGTEALTVLKACHANSALTVREVQEDVNRIIDGGYFCSCMPIATHIMLYLISLMITFCGFLWHKVEPNQEFHGMVSGVEILSGGVIRLQVAEAEVNNISIRFLDRKTGEPTKGKTRPETILRQLTTKKGQVYSMLQGKRDVETVLTMGIMEDVSIIPQPAGDVARVPKELVFGEFLPFGNISKNVLVLMMKKEILLSRISIAVLFTGSGKTHDDVLIAKFESVYTGSGNHGSSMFVFDMEQGLPVLPKWLFFNRVNAHARKGVDISHARLRLNLSGGHVIGNFYPHEAFAIGGTNSVRGYEEGAVGSGRSYVVGSGEITFPMIQGELCEGKTDIITPDKGWVESPANTETGRSHLICDLNIMNIFREMNEDYITKSNISAQKNNFCCNWGQQKELSFLTMEQNLDQALLCPPGDPAGARLKPGSGYGHGFGIRVDSPLGPLGLEYAFNDRQTRRFHFGVGHPN